MSDTNERIIHCDQFLGARSMTLTHSIHISLCVSLTLLRFFFSSSVAHCYTEILSTNYDFCWLFFSNILVYFRVMLLFYSKQFEKSKKENYLFQKFKKEAKEEERKKTVQPFELRVTINLEWKYLCAHKKKQHV